MSINPFDYNLRVVLDTFASGDHAKEFITHPRDFEKLLMSKQDTKTLLEDTRIIYGKKNSLPLVGSLAILCASKFKPGKAANVLQYNVASVNGAFVVYENQKNETLFMKVALANADYYEPEAIALQVIRTYAPKELQRYFLSYKCSCSALIYRDDVTNNIGLDLARYLSDSHNYSFFGQRTVNLPNTVVAPMLITNVVESGISLSQILTCWGNVQPSSNSKTIERYKKSMRIFHRSGIFDRAIGQPSLDKRIQSSASARILDKFDQFIRGVVTVAVPLKMTHGDLHAGNVLYDEVTDNFVLIDYGRVCLDLEHIAVTKDEIFDECAKIRSFNQSYVETQLQNPNGFYDMYPNWGSRKANDDLMITHFGILMDLASLAFYTMCTLKQRLQLNNHPIISYAPMSDTVVVGGPESQKQYFKSVDANQINMFDLMLAYFALILRAAYEAGELVATKADDGSLLIEYDDIMGSSNQPFYTYGQPQLGPYKKYKSQLESIAAEVEFFGSLKGALKKKMTSGQQGGKHKTKGMLTQLTKDNYIDNMQRGVLMSIINTSVCKNKNTLKPIQPIFSLKTLLRDSDVIEMKK